MQAIITMRADLIEEGLAVPASATFSNYDSLDDPVFFINAEELEGATYGDDPAHPDDHAFCYVELKDGRSLYFTSVDLDFDESNTKYEEWKVVATDHSGERYVVGRSVFSYGKYSYEKYPRTFKSKEGAERKAKILNSKETL